MPSLLVPRRRRGVEFLDDPAVDERVIRRSLADVALSNTLFGGTRAVLVELGAALAALDAPRASLLDVGTGLGDIPRHMREAARERGIELRTIGVESSEPLARAARCREMPTVRADALHLPFADRSIDFVTCSQVLHHFEGAQVVALLRELDRVARRRVIVSDIRRSWLAAAGIWVASYALGFHPVSRHDGVTSVLRGFTRRELRDAVRTAVGGTPAAHDRLGFRVTAAWRPAA